MWDKIVFNKRGESGNIFYILGQACAILLIQDRKADASQMMDRATSSHSYEEALQVVREYVELEEEA